MKHLRSRKGFTLIEMLVVIAIIAVLVAVIIPTVTSSTDKAKAAADAANLRNILGQMNSVLMTGADNIGEAVLDVEPPPSQLHSGAKLYVLYTVPGVIDVYYVDGENNYYGLDYLSKLAQGETPPADTSAPTVGAGDKWFIVGEGPA